MDWILSFQDYLLLEKKYSVHTAKAYVQDLNFFKDFLQNNFDGHDDLAEVNYSMIRNWIVALIDNEKSNTSVNRKIASLKAFYKYLLKSKQITVNPLSQHKSLKIPKKVQVPFSEKELEQLNVSEDFQSDFEGIRNQLILDLLYTTGMRRAELISLQMNSVDYTNGLVKVIGKRNKERLIPLLPEIIQKLKQYEEERGQLPTIIDYSYLLLTSKGNKLYDNLVYRIINNYLSAVTEKQKKSPHMLRHTFATHLLNNGADLSSVKELLGHSSLASTQVYTHSSLSELKNTYLNAHPRNKKE